jgi:hypothetical protein
MRIAVTRPLNEKYQTLSQQEWVFYISVNLGDFSIILDEYGQYERNSARAKWKVRYTEVDSPHGNFKINKAMTYARLNSRDSGMLSSEVELPESVINEVKQNLINKIKWATITVRG